MVNLSLKKGRGTGTPLEYTRFGGKGTIRLVLDENSKTVQYIL